MSSKVSRQLAFLTVISGRKQRHALADALLAAGGRLMNIVYGKGSAHVDFLREMFGFVPEENKAIITCLVLQSDVDAIMELLVTQFHFDSPNTGIAFTIPIENTSL